MTADPGSFDRLNHRSDSKQPFYILINKIAEFFRRHSANLCNKVINMFDIYRSIYSATQRHRRKIRRIGLTKETV